MIWIIFCLIPVHSFSYDVKVPLDCSKLQFWNRETRKGICKNTSKPIYHCAWDLFSKSYEELCWSRLNLIHKGKRPTIQGGLHFGNCPEDRYQPFPTTSKDTIDCVYLKSNCTEEGQVVHGDSELTSQDRTCRCDYRKGYAFVQEPKNVCFCIPSQEDCSCYQKRCENETVHLSQDYVCVDQPSIQNNQSYQCLPITGSETSGQLPDESNTKADVPTITDTVSSSSTLATVTFVSVVIIGVLMIVLLTSCPFCLRVIEGNKDLKEGQHASISVRVYGIAIVRKVKWTHGNSNSDLESDATGRYSESLESSNHFFHTATLNIYDITKEDAKKYVCSVSNSAGCFGPSKKTFDLHISPNPAAAVVRLSTEEEINQHTEDDTYSRTDAVNKGIDILEKYNTLFVKGHEGVGKTKVCLELAKYFSSRGVTIFKFSTNNVTNPDDFIYLEKDKICVYDLNIKIDALNQPAKDLLYTFNRHRDNKKVKFIITVLTNYASDTLITDSFKEAQILSLLQLSFKEKMDILQKHMNRNDIKTCEFSYDVNYKDAKPVLIWEETVEKICETNTLMGFPKACKLFCENRSLLSLEERYFKNPPKWLIKEIASCRIDTATKLQYAVLVYVMMKKELNTSDMDNDRMHEITRKLRIDIYEHYELTDALDNLSNKFLRQDGNIFKFYHEGMSKAVWLTYIDIDSSYCITNCAWEYIEDLVRPSAWQFNEYDVGKEAKPADLLLRLSDEMKTRAWFVGVYLCKLSDGGKDIAEKLFSRCMERKCKTDNETAVILTLFDGMTENGQKCGVFAKLNVANEMLSWSFLDRFRNNLFHYCALHDYVNLVLTFTEDQIDMFVNAKNKKGYTAFDLTAFLGRKSIFEHISGKKGTIGKENFKILRNLSFAGVDHCSKCVDLSEVEVNVHVHFQIVLTRNTFFGDKGEFGFIKWCLFKLKNTIEPDEQQKHIIQETIEEV